MNNRPLIAALLLVVWMTGAWAESPQVLLDQLTWTEVRTAIRSGQTTIIIPIGGIEQNGPAIALGKHNVRVLDLSTRIAKSLGNALVAPVVAYVPEGDVDAPSGHLAFPGTITVPNKAFDTVIEYAARSFKLHGFRDIVLLGDHGGYQSELKLVADRLNKEWAATPVRVHFIAEYYAASQAGFADVLMRRGFSSDEIGSHAGLNDTSLMLAIDPSMVRMDIIQSRRSFQPSDGVAGNPARSSAQLGQLGVDLIVSETVAAIRAATKR